ncbi:uncharacterized protein LOC118193967 [Stegodyphus dumicola]|uniref:uncharacterized protein LOC118193967 n=1 Tax=Stegodyphus dumicola TaxID=202533 RepID=UPI0015AD7573|nr:uncharacterized protein LOC118193967 [Stegodyphus dumicola]
MSSDHDESVEHLDDQNAQLGVTKMDTVPLVKETGVSEHPKPKRRRRGKKRKHRKESAATCENENHDECESEQHVEDEHENHVDCESPTWDSDEDLSCDINAFTDVIIRPVNVPKAPKNSTQFIIDDHNECRLYMSFETPNPYSAGPPNFEGKDCILTEPDFEDAAYRDIDYEYESPQDFDNSAYYDREFELSYKSNRFDELMLLPRSQLIAAYTNLELRLKELNDELAVENPSHILEKLQAELLELQEKHSFLKECNAKLTAVVLKKESDCPEDASSTDLTASMSVSHNEHMFDISSDSDKELSQEVAAPEHLSDEPNSGSDSDIQNVGINSSSGESCEETNDIEVSNCPQLVSEEETEDIEDRLSPEIMSEEETDGIEQRLCSELVSEEDDTNGSEKRLCSQTVSDEENDDIEERLCHQLVSGEDTNDSAKRLCSQTVSEEETDGIEERLCPLLVSEEDTNDIGEKLCSPLVSEEQPTQTIRNDSSHGQILLNDSNSHDNYNTEASHCTVEVCAELKVHENCSELHVKQANISAIEAP